MTIPADLTKVHLDADSDDPTQARGEIEAIVDAVNTLIAHFNASNIMSESADVGNGLAMNAAVLDAINASTVAIGVARFATDGEAQNLSSPSLIVSPGNLNTITATTLAKGLLRLATPAEAAAGTGATQAVTPLDVATYVAANSGGTAPVRTVHLGNTTYNKPAGLTALEVTVVGAGGTWNVNAANGTTFSYGSGGTTFFGGHISAQGGGSVKPFCTGGHINYAGERNSGTTGNNDSWGGSGVPAIHTGTNPHSWANYVNDGAYSGSWGTKMIPAASLAAATAISIGGAVATVTGVGQTGVNGIVILTEYF